MSMKVFKPLKGPFSQAASNPAASIDLPLSPGALEFNPNDFSAGENCYAYALNRQGQNREFNPGYIALQDGKEYVHFDRLFQYEIDRLSNESYDAYVKKVKAHFESEAVRDGLIPIEEQKGCASGAGYFVAMVMKDHSHKQHTVRDIDYHWLRQNPDGTWSHKTPSTLPTNKDSDNNLIMDPRTANLGDYKHFVGFFFVPQKIKPLQATTLKMK